MLQSQWQENAAKASTIDLPNILIESGHDPYLMQEAGDIDAGFAHAANILEATYFIPYVSNAPMEPRAAVAAWDGDNLTVWAGTQRPFGIRQELAQRFDIAGATGARHRARDRRRLRQQEPVPRRTRSSAPRPHRRTRPCASPTRAPKR